METEVSSRMCAAAAAHSLRAPFFPQRKLCTAATQKSLLFLDGRIPRERTLLTHNVLLSGVFLQLLQLADHEQRGAARHVLGVGVQDERQQRRALDEIVVPPDRVGRGAEVVAFVVADKPLVDRAYGGGQFCFVQLRLALRHGFGPCQVHSRPLQLLHAQATFHYSQERGYAALAQYDAVLEGTHGALQYTHGLQYPEHFLDRRQSPNFLPDSPIQEESPADS